jgi:hypothetical protein
MPQTSVKEQFVKLVKDHKGIIIKVTKMYPAVFTFATIVWGHFYYKRTYFIWLNNLKKNLDELEQE